MKQSQNKPLGKNKYYNTQRGKKDNHFFFFLPTFFVSPKKLLHWDTEMRSIFFTWGRYYFQYNIFEIIQSVDLQIEKETIANLFEVLKENHYYLNIEEYNIQHIIEFLNSQTYLITLLKGAHLSHDYTKKIITEVFREQPFIIQK